MNDETEVTVQAHYEYAGFLYTLIRSADGDVRAVPEPGQHPAARKQKHRMAALDSWQQEQSEHLS